MRAHVHQQWKLLKHSSTSRYNPKARSTKTSAKRTSSGNVPLLKERFFRQHVQKK